MELAGTPHLELASPSSESPAPEPPPSGPVLRATGHAPWKPPLTEPIRRLSTGLLATGLDADLRTRVPSTVLAPVDAAFDALPFSFEDLLFDERLVEARFDLFEYLVIRGTVDANGPREAHVTVHGEPVRVGRGLVLGRYGAARVLRTFASGQVTVHVLDQCVFPVYPRLYMVETRRWTSPQG